MRQREDNRQQRKGTHLNWEERIQIETLQRVGLSTIEIGERIDRPARTIKRELKRGWVLNHTSRYSVQERYSADRGQTIYEQRMSGRTQTLEVDKRLAGPLRTRILKHRESPEVITSQMKSENLEYTVCAKTIYNLIDRNLIEGVSNESLWEKRRRRKRSFGPSMESRGKWVKKPSEQSSKVSLLIMAERSWTTKP